MAEPTSTTTAVAAVAGISFASLFPGIDGNALIGAFAGATLFVVSSKDLTVVQRFAYLFISLVIGYQGAQEIIAVTSLRSTGIAAFVAAAIAIILTLQLIERLKSMDMLSALFKKGGGK